MCLLFSGSEHCMCELHALSSTLWLQVDNTGILARRENSPVLIMFEVSCQGGFLDLHGTLCEREIKTVVLSHWDFRAYLSLQKSLRTPWVSLFFNKALAKTARVTGYLLTVCSVTDCLGRVLITHLQNNQRCS